MTHYIFFLEMCFCMIILEIKTHYILLDVQLLKGNCSTSNLNSGSVIYKTLPISYLILGALPQVPEHLDSRQEESPAGYAVQQYISALSHGVNCSKLEVVKVVRECEATLTKRLIEFENTKSGSLTLMWLSLTTVGLYCHKYICVSDY
ncbi:uncharacterized protein LOC130777073 [Actinidia eriantha]|uniref:uncharacterized protein LOC130777073 n=1 Tax=Actinidia eriantha TaxID=165200 RepID=UPI002584DB61|nr:uncharacterized protein LOC130777073 [Actinidia eriantha]